MRIIISLLITLLLFLGYYAIESQKTISLVPEQFLPEDTLVYAEQRNGLINLEKFRLSRMGKSLEQIDYAEVAEYLELKESVIDGIDHSIETIHEIYENGLFRKLLGPKFSLAVFPKRAWSLPVLPLAEYVKHQTLIISRQHSLRSVISIARKGLPGLSNMQTAVYGEYTIYRFSYSGESFSVTYVGGLLLAAFDERLLREALSIRDKPAKNLLHNLDYIKFSNDSKGADRKVFLDTAKLREICEIVSQNMQPSHEQLFLSEIANLKGFTIAGYAAWRNKKVIQDRVMIKISPGELLALTRKMLSHMPEHNETIPFIVEDALFYYWSNTLNIPLLWEMYIQETGLKTSEVDEISSQIKEISGYKIDDLTSMIDNDIGFILRPSIHDQFIPLPDTALLIKLNDRKGIKKVIDNITTNFDITLQSRRYKSVKYFYWGLYPQESLQPVYAIHKGYLILANTLDIFKSIVDLPADKDPLASSIVFAPVDPGFKEKNNSVCYIDQKTFLGQMRELVSWTGTMLALQDRKAAAKSKILIDRLINPLLLGLTMYEKAATRTYIQGNWIITASRTQTE